LALLGRAAAVITGECVFIENLLLIVFDNGGFQQPVRYVVLAEADDFFAVFGGETLVSLLVVESDGVRRGFCGAGVGVGGSGAGGVVGAGGSGAGGTGGVVGAEGSGAGGAGGADRWRRWRLSVARSSSRWIIFS